MLKVDLCGKWSFHEEGSDKWLPAIVPGCNFTDLLENGKISNPFIGTNESQVQWVAEKEWEYTREFNLSTEMLKKKKIILNCEMLDTLAEVYINNILIAKTENSHIAYEWDIKNHVTKLTNNIRIKFLSPIAYMDKKQSEDAMPANHMGITGVPHIRKAQSHMGWDWGPILPISGITKSIFIIGYSEARIEKFFINQKHAQGRVELIVDINLEGKIEREYSILTTVITPSKLKIQQKSIYCQGFVEKIDIENPELWWTNDLSDKDVQPLYTVEVELIEDEKTIDKQTKRIGLRTITLNRNKDGYGKNFQFILNGIRIFAKGANWIPSDSFINRFTKEKVEYFIKAVANSNMNMLRVWGGGYYESEDFYDLCDEHGILVWQDFCFACAPYPFYNEEFLENVKAEIQYNVNRLKHRASLCLWCGNNEIEMMTPGWMNKRTLIKWTKTFFHEILPVELKKYDNVTPFVVGSPSASEFLKSVNSDKDGDTHLWHVWHGLQPLNYYRKRFTRFCSEFGLQSLPDLKTIKGFAEEKDYSLKSPVFMAHQKCASGNNKMLYYMSTRFRLPKTFEDTIYLSQLIQNECVKDATEHWRRNSGECNGSLYWQLNDCWPVTSWSSIDYEGRYKALQYGARHFNAPLTISIEDKKNKVKIYALNDYNQPFQGKIIISMEDFDGNLIKSDEFAVQIQGVSSNCIAEIDYKAELKTGKKNKVMIAELYDGEDLVSRKTVMFTAEKYAEFKNPNLTLEVQAQKGIAYVTIKADKFARFVKVDLLDSFKPFSDNCFDMLAGEEVTISIPVDNKLTEEELQKALSVTCINNIVPKGSRFSDTLTRMKIALIPINILNYIYYHFV